MTAHGRRSNSRMKTTTNSQDDSDRRGRRHPRAGPDPAMKVVVMSGNSAPQPGASAVGFLPKPFTSEELLTIVEQSLPMRPPTVSRFWTAS